MDIAEEIILSKINEIKKRVQKLLDDTAKTYGYDSIFSVCTYTGFTNEFQTEAITIAKWRSNVWSYCYQELDKITNNLRTEPTIEEFLTELPQLNLEG